MTQTTTEITTTAQPLLATMIDGCDVAKDLGEMSLYRLNRLQTILRTIQRNYRDEFAHVLEMSQDVLGQFDEVAR